MHFNGSVQKGRTMSEEPLNRDKGATYGSTEGGTEEPEVQESEKDKEAREAMEKFLNTGGEDPVGAGPNPGEEDPLITRDAEGRMVEQDPETGEWRRSGYGTFDE
jgi:hypothetical protein